MRKGDWIQTYTGRAVYPLDMQLEDIDIYDIAHALSLICRFNGHCRKFYSVAEHSYLVYLSSRDEYMMYGLLHDAAEAYTGDIPRPVKRSITEFKGLDKYITSLVYKKFGLASPVTPEYIEDIDKRLLLTEREQNMNKCKVEWVFNQANMGLAPIPIELRYWSPIEAEQMFLAAFEHCKHLTF